MPTLIVRGDNDSPVYAAMTDKIRQGIPHLTTVVIPGGTHFLNLEKPNEFNQAVLKFLRGRENRLQHGELSTLTNGALEWPAGFHDL